MQVLNIMFNGLKATGWKWKARSEERAKTCNVQPDILLMPALLLIAPTSILLCIKINFPIFVFLNENYARRNPQ
jgi:hypothetical protein